MTIVVLAVKGSAYSSLPGVSINTANPVSV
jgi:hypothetical protein